MFQFTTIKQKYNINNVFIKEIQRYVCRRATNTSLHTVLLIIETHYCTQTLSNFPASWLFSSNTFTSKQNNDMN